MSTIIYNSENGLKLTVLGPEDNIDDVRSVIENVHTDWTYIGTDIFPSDSKYGTEVYDWDNGLILNLSRVKEVVKNRLRDLRQPKLTELDIIFMRNLENGVDNSDIIAEKNRLRNLPELIDAANTVDEIEAIGV